MSARHSSPKGPSTLFLLICLTLLLASIADLWLSNKGLVPSFMPSNLDDIVAVVSIAGALVGLAPKVPTIDWARFMKILVASIVIVALIFGSLIVIPRIASGRKSSTLAGQKTFSPTPTRQITPVPNPYPPYTGTLVLSDPLKDNSQGYGWSENDTCQFKNGSYHILVTEVANLAYSNCKEAQSFTNFAFEIQLTLLAKGGGGVRFRYTPDTSYVFAIGSDHGYLFSKHTNPGIPDKTLDYGTLPGSGQSYLLGIVVDNTNISIYVNHQPVETNFQDTQPPVINQGEICLTAIGLGVTSDVAAGNARLWDLG